MDVQERDELLRLLRSLEQTRVPVKDFVAETLILEACARQPDALYLLVQRVMALQAALAAARAQHAQRGPDPAAGHSSSLPSGDTGTANTSRPWTQGVLAQAAVVAAGAAAGVLAGTAAASLLDDLDPSDWL
jgi:hypothetical protein